MQHQISVFHSLTKHIPWSTFERLVDKHGSDFRVRRLDSKWIKQNLKIRHFLGTSENAVRTQVFVALTAYILLRMAQATQQAVKQPLVFVRLVRLNLMHKRPIDSLKRPFQPPPKDQRQISLKLNPC